MNCEEIGELLPDYLQGRLSSDRAEVVEKHLSQCAACGEEAALWKNLALLPEEQPSPALESRFKAMLESYQEGRWEKTSLAAENRKIPVPMLWGLGNWRQLPAAGIVWACLFLVCGYFIGKHADRGTDAAAQAQINEMRQELGATRQMVALSMLQQQSASQRLEGVSWSTRLPEPDPKVMSALLHTVRFDNSVDVRLAALDALGRYADRPEVRRELVDVLQTTQSPMVQVALIDLLVDLHDKSAVPQFKKFQQDPHVNPTVKKRVDWGIQQLN
ncbi:MAG TPA: zf-HC2 domain-containing protein [Candidatus Angelobacter sp.]|jgi:anti-sigma factor RsiW|nr:zf-HC2 domain-containing protein [Candidatus Angelobacter sp.]